MKKFGLLLIGGIAAIVLLANLGPLLALAITLVMAYLVIREFLKAKTTGSKIVWGLIAFVVLMFSISNVPSLFGLVAAFVLYLVYKKWDESKVTVVDNDPFTNFEHEWANLNK